MAAVDWYQFSFLDPAPGFQPGQTRTWEHGENPGFSWFGKAVVVTAQPFDATQQNRNLRVVNVDHQSLDVGVRRLRYSIQNLGPNTISIYNVFIGVIRQ